MNLTETNEADLLGVMAKQDTDGEEARAAWGELYDRHRRYVYVVASRSYGSFLGEDGTVDLVVDTFQRAYDWAGRQPNSDEVRAQFIGDNPDSTRRRVLGWLGAIAQRLFKDRFREHAVEVAEQDEVVEDLKRRQEESDGASDSSSLARLQDALATLSPTDADALRVSLPWYDLESRSFAVPRGEAARLADLFGISTETLRQRRHRAIKKLESYLQEVGPGERSKEKPQ
jgi:RNA polymerase sigma factor (sigma-70 family)